MPLETDWMAIVLAGGVGRRLSPLTNHTPKPLINVANRPMIEYALDLLHKNGIRKIVLAIRYMGDQIREWVENNVSDDLEIIIPNIEPNGTAEAVRMCEQYIDRNFIVTMADIITNINIQKAIKFHEEGDSFATICLKPVEFPGHFGLTMIDTDNRIHLFLEKPTPQELMMTTRTFAPNKNINSLHQNLANIGIYIFQLEILDILTSYADLVDFGLHVFPYLMEQKTIVKGFITDEYWMDAGTVLKYIWANNDIIREWSYPYLPKEQKIERHYWRGDDVEIHENCKIIPPVLIGSGSKIDKNCVIGPFVTIGKNCRIQKNVKVIDSVLHEGVIIHNNSRLSYCVIGDRSHISSNLKIKKYILPADSNLVEADPTYEWS